MDGPGGGDRHPFVDFDNTVFGRVPAPRRLIARGRRHLLLIAPPRNQTYAMNMIDGATSAAAAAGVAFEVMEGASSDSPSLEVEARIRARFSTGLRPDGIISASTSAAIAATAGIEAEGLKLGREADLIAKEAVPFTLLASGAGDLSVYEDVAEAGACSPGVIRGHSKPDCPRSRSQTRRDGLTASGLPPRPKRPGPPVKDTARLIPGRSVPFMILPQHPSLCGSWPRA